MPAHIKENFTHLSLLSHLNRKLTIQLLKKEKETEELRHELKEMSLKLDSLTEDHKRLEAFVEQEIEELRSEATSDIDMLKAEIQDGSAALSKKIGSLKKNFNRKFVTKNKMNAVLRKEIDQVNATDIANLWEDVAELTEKQEQDRTELEKQATGLCHFHKHGVVPVEIVMPDFEEHKAAGDMWRSDPFYTHPGGYKICVGVSANGISNSTGTHALICALLSQGEFDHHLKWPIVRTITIQLLNQVEDQDHHELIIRLGEIEATRQVIHVGEPAILGLGHISHTRLYNHTISPRYLKNNCIHFRVAKFREVIFVFYTCSGSNSEQHCYHYVPFIIVQTKLT